jgi:hypothetical protein
LLNIVVPVISNCDKIKYDKQDQQDKAALNVRNPDMTQQHEPVARSPGRPQTKKQHRAIGRLITKMINNM